MEYLLKEIKTGKLRKLMDLILRKSIGLPVGNFEWFM